MYVIEVYMADYIPMYWVSADKPTASRLELATIYSSKEEAAITLREAFNYYMKHLDFRGAAIKVIAITVETGGG